VQRNQSKVVLFPTLKEDLERKSLEALEQKKYSKALVTINKLLSYHIYSHEILIGKLICLIELGNYTEAEDLCIDLLKLKDEHYYNYLHIYLTILFQTEKFTALMNQIDAELTNNSLPYEFKSQFQQLYQLAKQMKVDMIAEESTEFLDNLHVAFDEQDFVKQWQLIENLRKMSIDPPQEVITYLSKKDIHPVIKTAIFKWLVDLNYSSEVAVEKFNLKVFIKPTNIPKVRDHVINNEIIYAINEIEQNNPSLFIMLEQLLYRYLYALYPIFPPTEDVPYIAEALKQIGEQYLHLAVDRQSTTKKALHYIKEIQMCEQLYLAVIEE